MKEPSSSYWDRVLAEWRHRRVRAMIRPLVSRDRSVVARDLTPVLSARYPGADRWLDRRLQDILEGRAICDLARDRAGLLAIAIETPKGDARSKLSTIWVANRARHRGFGTALIDRRRRQWIEREMEETWVTASCDVAPVLEQLLVPRGFRVAALEEKRYGSERDEIVYRWRPSQDTLLTATEIHAHRPWYVRDAALAAPGLVA